MNEETATEFIAALLTVALEARSEPELVEAAKAIVERGFGLAGVDVCLARSSRGRQPTPPEHDDSALCLPIKVGGDVAAWLVAPGAASTVGGPSNAAKRAADVLGAAIDAHRRVAGAKQAEKDARAALHRSLRADETKDRFISAISHELRTPLTSIRSFAEILLSNTPEDTETVHEFLSIIHDESIRLTRLVNNLLDFSKIRAGRMEWQFEEDDLEAAIQRAVRSISSLAREKRIEVRIDAQDDIPPIVFDRDKLLQILVNLLSNAIKYTPEGAAVTIIAKELPDGGARVTIRDEGPGIPESYRAKVFERFSQVSDPQHQQPGTGIGLSLTFEFVKAHGGRIWVEAAPTGGSDFVFDLPAIPPPTSNASTTTDSES